MTWWGYILVFIAGACTGAIVMGICAANRTDENGKKWWENDE